MSGEKSAKKRTLSSIIVRWLAIVLVAVWLAAALLTYYILKDRSEREAFALVRKNVEDATAELYDVCDLTLNEEMNRLIGLGWTTDMEASPENLQTLQDYQAQYRLEVDIVDNDGVIVLSSVPEYVGFDLHSGEQGLDFLAGMEASRDLYSQELRSKAYDDATAMKYAGKWFPDRSGFLQIGLTPERFYDLLRYQAEVTASFRRIGEQGYQLNADKDLTIISSFEDQHTGESLVDAGIEIDPDRRYAYENRITDVYGVPCYVCINEVEGLYVICVYPVSEVTADDNRSMNTFVAFELLVFAILFVAIAMILRKLIVEKIVKVNEGLKEITEGNLDTRIEVRDTLEFDSLSTDINTTVDRLKGYIAEAAARIDAELELARLIQMSVLPRNFPAFPERKDFDVRAFIEPAKEVGGDFYDFFLIDENHLALVIADVSGKGISAAMFMMNAKSLIKNRAERGGSPAEILRDVNGQLCENNESELFVTVWLAILDLSTGQGFASNAGHENPTLMHSGESFQMLVYKHSPMLAMFDGISFRENSFELLPGDRVFVYTDGVPEASDAERRQFGYERMMDALNRHRHEKPEALLESMKREIDGFVGDAPQFDDITMLCLDYFGPQHGNGRKEDHE